MIVFKQSLFEFLDCSDDQPGFFSTFTHGAVVGFLARFALAAGKLSVPGQNLPRRAEPNQVLTMPFDNGNSDPCCVQSSCLTTGLQGFGEREHVVPFEFSPVGLDLTSMSVISNSKVVTP